MTILFTEICRIDISKQIVHKANTLNRFARLLLSSRALRQQNRFELTNRWASHRFIYASSAMTLFRGTDNTTGFVSDLQSLRHCSRPQRWSYFSGQIMFIQTQSMPNPSSLMFYPGKAVMDVGSADFPNARAVVNSPLATAIFGIDGMFMEIAAPLAVGCLAWVYLAILPPPPRTCGSSGGPPITAPRIKLRDGRYLAYMEHGVCRELAKYKIIFIHGFSSTRHDGDWITAMSPALVEELGVYILSFDRPGYGESDPHPQRTPKSLALDIEELADHLGLGSKFYLIGSSMGGQAVWGCLKYIPHRLAGAALLAPVINYWWPSFPANLSKEAYYRQLPQDQWALRVAHYAPWLTYWWNTQKLFPASAVATRRAEVFSPQDLQILALNLKSEESKLQARQQGEFESIHRDMMVGFGKWEFDPMELENPFPNNEGSVHLWQGDDDRKVPISLQKYISQRLPWIQFHEVPGSGHSFRYVPGMCDAILNALILGEK